MFVIISRLLSHPTEIVFVKSMNLRVLAPLFAFVVLASAQNLYISTPIKGQLVLKGSDLPVRVETDVCLVSLFSKTQTN